MVDSIRVRLDQLLIRSVTLIRSVKLIKVVVHYEVSMFDYISEERIWEEG